MKRVDPVGLILLIGLVGLGFFILYEIASGGEITVDAIFYLPVWALFVAGLIFGGVWHFKEKLKKWLKAPPSNR